MLNCVIDRDAPNCYTGAHVRQKLQICSDIYVTKRLCILDHLIQPDTCCCSFFGVSPPPNKHQPEPEPKKRLCGMLSDGSVDITKVEQEIIYIVSVFSNGDRTAQGWTCETS